MAGRTHSIRVAVVDRELRVLRVIERRIQPARSGVASLASRWEKLRLRGMPWIRRVVVVGLVAANASGRKRGVVVVNVAVGANARWHGVHSGQWECSVVVIKGCVGPLHRVMAELAGRRESRVRNRTFSIIEICLVACNAERAVQIVVVVDVAIRASPWRDCVGTSQREAGL